MKNNTITVKLTRIPDDEEFLYTWECPECHGNYTYSRRINAQWGHPKDKVFCAVCSRYYNFNNVGFPTYGISVEQWNKLTPYEQEEYIKDNDINVCYTHDISDTLQRGFGKLHDMGYWEYTCKKI